MLFGFLNRYRDEGLLLLRVGLGAMFLYHGFPKLSGGPEKWAQIGKAMESVGIAFAPVFWGFMAAVAEFGGGLCVMLGALFRPACLLLTIDLAVATSMHFHHGDGLFVASHAIEDGIVFLSLLLIGPGKYSVDEARGRRGG